MTTVKRKSRQYTCRFRTLEGLVVTPEMLNRLFPASGLVRFRHLTWRQSPLREQDTDALLNPFANRRTTK